MSTVSRLNRRISTGAGWASLALLAASLSACGGGGDGTPTGTLKLALTDAPGCGYEHVYVTVTQVRVHQSANATGAQSEAGWNVLDIPPQRIDLLALTNGVLNELGSLPLPAGSYQQIRLVLANNPGSPSPSNPLANALVLTSAPATEVALTTPSAQQSGFKLQANFTVNAGQVADMVLDFDACRSVVRAGNSGQYNLKPVVSVIPRLTTAIEGYVNPSLASAVVVSTRDSSGNLRSTIPNTTTGKFTLAYLPEDTNYTVVVSGQGLTTAAVTGVPVSLATGVTTLNTSGSAINPATSPTGTVSGTVRNSSSTLLTEATVAATQTLSTGQLIDVASTAVDPTTAGYAFTLAVNPPLKASYSSSGSHVFAADSASVGGAYDLRGTATGYTSQSTLPGTTLTSGGTLTKDLVLAP
jgi:Domain of unknown function (DUF4382)